MLTALLIFVGLVAYGNVCYLTKKHVLPRGNEDMPFDWLFWPVTLGVVLIVTIGYALCVLPSRTVERFVEKRQKEAALKEKTLAEALAEIDEELNGKPLLPPLSEPSTTQE